MTQINQKNTKTPCQALMGNKKEKVQKNVPTLRFGRFNGDWEEKRLGDIADFLKGKGISKKDVKKDAENKCIRYGELYTEYNETINDVVSKTNVKKEGSVLSERNDLLIPSSGETNIDIATVSCLEKEGIILGGDINIIKLQKDNNGEFFSYYLSNYKKKELARFGQGHSVVHLYSNHFKNIKINIPQKEEQKKIADFLSGVDEYIVNLEEQKEELEKYKKGTMQKIFSRKIRFHDKNGNSFPDWEEKRLGEVAEVYQPKTISQTELKKEGFSVYGANGIIGKYNKYNHKKEQIAVTCRGNTCGVVNFTKPKSWITGNAMVINLDNSNNTLKFFIYYQLINTELGYLITGSGQPQITGDIKKHKINLPTLPEQKKIADFLSSIDEIIQLKDQQITKAKNWKKGLMQRLFV